MERGRRFGAERFAIKHTLLEPFVGGIQTGKEFQELTGAIFAELDRDLPVPGVYDLVFLVHPTAGQRRRTHAALR